MGKSRQEATNPPANSNGLKMHSTVGLKGAGDRDLPLTGAGNPEFPGQKEAVAPHTC